MARSAARVLALVAILVAATAGCDSSTAPTATTAPVNVRAVDQGFALETSLPKVTWAAGEVIPITTTFTWTGPEPRKTLSTFGSGPVTFDLKQLDGPLFQMGGPHTADCAPKTFDRGVARPVPFQKSVAWQDDDPNAAFYQQFAADPLLRLPAGRFELRVGVDAQLAECTRNGPSLGLQLPPIVLEVR